MKWQSL